jgi:hypothetical protein
LRSEQDWGIEVTSYAKPVFLRDSPIAFLRRLIFTEAGAAAASTVPEARMNATTMEQARGLAVHKPHLESFYSLCFQRQKARRPPKQPV